MTYEIQRIDDEWRSESNLPEVDRSVRELGVGGSGIEFYFDENIDQSQKAALTANKLTLEEIERQLKFELNSYKNLVIHFNSIEDSIKYLPLIFPLPEDQLKRISDKFGNRMHPILGIMKNHYGIDMSAPTGTPVYATADGYVDYASRNSGYGEYIRIRHKSQDKNYGYQTRYAHLSKYHVKRGDWVKRGDLIGEVGSTGRSNAPHLHYEVHFKGKPINPDEYYFLSGI